MSDYQPKRPDVKQFVIVISLVGVVIAVGLLLWQGQSYKRDLALLDSKLAAAEAVAGSNSATVQELQDKLDSAVATATTLAERNAVLTAEVARVQAELDVRNAKPVVTVTARNVSPVLVVASNSLDVSVSVRGRATKVQMKLVGPTGAPDTQVFDLVRYSTAGGVDTWQRNMTAPWKPGEYLAYAMAFIGDSKFVLSGDAGFPFRVQ